MSSETAATRMRETIMRDRDRIARGERPAYTVTKTPATEALDVRITELPLVHIFVPDEAGVLDGARVLIARTLEVEPSAFDLRLA